MSLALTVASMTASGCSADQINAVVQAHEAAREKEIVARRAKKAEQKRKERSMSPNVAATGGDSERPDATSGDAPFLDKESPHTPKEINPNLTKENPPKGGQKKGSRLPDGWCPSADAFDYGTGLGFSQSQIEDFAEEMRLWAAQKAGADGLKLDWGAAFKGWMRRAKKQMPRAGPNKSASKSMLGLLLDDLGENYQPHECRPLKLIGSHHA